MEHATGASFVSELRATVNEQWARIKEGGFWRRVIEGGPVSRALYRDLMLQVYHYSQHNSMNQAVAAFVPAPESLLKFAYRHAAEELGHEKMIVHDLRVVGLWDEADVPPPLPATEALIGYLYFVSLRYGALARLGYSFWAEDVYGHIQAPFARIRADLQLPHNAITFFGSHAEADADHIRQVEDAIVRHAITPAQCALVTQVAKTTLFLTGQLLEQVEQIHR